ncbi:MAG: glycosyltransferase [Angustibacter sp.]
MVVASDVRLKYVPGEGWWATHPSLSLAALDRYLALGQPVVLVARRCSPEAGGVHLLQHERLTVFDVGADDKASGLARRTIDLGRRAARLPIRRGDLVVMRVPEVASLAVGFVALLRRATLVSNVVAEPDAIASHLPHLAGIPRRVYIAMARLLVRRSAGTVFVTERVLQEQLPPRPGSPTMTASNVRLEPREFVDEVPAAVARDAATPLRIVAVGSMETNGKGFDVLVRALRLLREQGLNVELDLVGDGARRRDLESLARDEQVERATTFHGHVSGRPELLKVLDSCDVLAMPSRNEGLPRAMIEAMARGLCVVGSRVGGIVELAEPECLFPPDDPTALAECLGRLYASPQRLAELAAAGRARAEVIADHARPERFTSFLRDVHCEAVRRTRATENYS